ncbi:MAG: hypothetical protein LDL53_03370 [Candidatus Hydrogenedens sp.]|nr:hypothetical protein [Candidatus Hydrogenedens sp.]
MSIRKKIYFVTPFNITDYPLSWKAYYCVELFSELAKRGYIVTWLQPSKDIFSLNLFPSLSRWRDFFVINIGNYYTYRWYMPFFLSRLKKVSKDVRPFILFEIIDKNPLPINIDQDYFVIPIIFSLGRKWIPTDEFPGPVIVPDKKTFIELVERGIPHTCLNYIPCAYNRYENVSNENCQDYLILIIDSNRELEKIFGLLKRQIPGQSVVYFSKKVFKMLRNNNFCEILTSFQNNYKEIIVVLGNGLFHLALELSANGGIVIMPKERYFIDNKIDINIIYYNSFSEIPSIVNEVKGRKEAIVKPIIDLAPWKQAVAKVEEIVAETVKT